MPYCCVPYCCSSSKIKENISFHQIPVEESRRGLWLKAISRQGPSKDSAWVPNQYDVVCQKHFRHDDYRQGPKRLLLKKDAVPSIFPNYPAYLQPPAKKPRRSLVNKEPQNMCVQSSDTTEPLENDENLTSLHPPIEELQKQNTALKQKLKRVITALSKARQRFKKLDKQNKSLLKRNADLTQKLTEISDIEEEAAEGSAHAIFILDQIKSRKKKLLRWSPEVIRICILWQRCSPNGYKHVRKSKFLNLPCKTTLNKYIGYGIAETGFSSLVKKRLLVEKNNLSENELYGSLIIDEMSIKPMINHDKFRDKIFGFVEMGGIESEIGMEHKLAKHLLCFFFSGLSTVIRIPVAFYFTLQLRGIDLCKLTKKILSEVENIGFKICRIVTDNLRVNTLMFKELCGGSICPSIVHPEDKSRKLFISYDYCHIIKNIRNQFLSNKKRLNNQGAQISPCYLYKLYNLQKDQVIKPVRFLTRKHLYPSSPEKMNVKRAIDIFRPEVTAALKYLQKYGKEKGIHGFEDAGPTINFMDIIYRWFTIHNVHNTTQHIHKNQPDSMEFFSVSDERLQWLKNDFLTYLEEWHAGCTNKKLEFFSMETYEAIVLTTKSTVETVIYLLEKGFHYVLTRKFSSDDIESFFGYIRRLNGCNDLTNASAATDVISKILKVGIIKNTKTLPENPENLRNKQDPADFAQAVSYYESLLSEDIKKLEKVVEFPENSIKTATFSVIAGYLTRTVEENIDCIGCFKLLVSEETDSPLNYMISQVDRGGLNNTKDEEIAASPLAWLHGTWESEEATVQYPTMETVKYFELMEFKPMTPILIDYKSQSWHAETKEKMHQEQGFVKIHSDSGKIAFVASHNFGLTELDEGTVDGQTLHLESRFLNWISWTKLTPTRKVIRDFVLKDNVLYQTVLMETIKTPLQDHLIVIYKKKI